jgi:Clustered mitochondria
MMFCTVVVLCCSRGAKKSSSEVLADSYSGMLRLTQDFEYAAVTYAKIIVSELALPPEQKSIKPLSRKSSSLPLRGECYAVQSIIFHVTNSSLLKRNTDIDESSFQAHSQEVLLGDIDYISTKLLGNDMRGATSLFNCDSSAFSVPLRSIIDYHGFRLLASSQMPIHNEDVRVCVRSFLWSPVRCGCIRRSVWWAHSSSCSAAYSSLS